MNIGLEVVLKIVVLLKETPDTESKINISEGNSSLDFSQIKMIVNPYDEFAVEEALKVASSNTGSEVVVATFGYESSVERVRKALAMGADRGVVIDKSGFENIDALGVSAVLAKLIEKEQPSLVLCGKQGVDDDNMHVPTMTAEFLGWPSINVVTKIEPLDNGWHVEREVEGGQIEIYEVEGPVLIGAHKSLNQPRYASLPGIMKAKRKPLDLLKPSDLGMDSSELNTLSQTSVESYYYPPEKPEGKIFQGEAVEAMVDKVVKLMREEAKVI